MGISARTLCDTFYHTNPILVFDMSGSELQAILQRACQLRGTNRREGHGDFLQVAGLKIEADDSVVTKVTVISALGSAEPLQPTARYSVATLRYIAKKSEYRDLFTGGVSREAHPDLKQAVASVLAGFAEMEVNGIPWEMVLNQQWGWTFR